MKKAQPVAQLRPGFRCVQAQYARPWPTLVQLTGERPLSLAASSWSAPAQWAGRWLVGHGI